MLVRKQQNVPRRPSSSELNALGPGHAIFCSEFKYRRGIEIFGEAEPIEYLYQVRAEQFEAINCWLTVGGRKVAAFLIEMDVRLTATDILSLPMNRRDIADYLG